MFFFSSFGQKKAASPPPSPNPQPHVAAAKEKFNAAHVPPLYQRSAALTYYSAPYPVDSTEGIFEAFLLLAADKIDVNGSSAKYRTEPHSWWGRAWKRVADYSAIQLLKTRQADFLAAFSRQLELNPSEESSVVMVSCHSHIVSNGELYFGTLYATNCGLYFCAAPVQATANSNTVKSEMEPASSQGSSAEAAPAEPELIKERVLFTDMASFLPSIALEQKDGAPPFIQGIPSGVVAPNALQVFTVRHSTVVQFVGLQDVVVKPPRKAAAERNKSEADAVQDASCTDVVRRRECALIEGLPSSMSTLKFCALLWRLWTNRLNGLGMPLKNPAARYAEPH
jgi:hypothetical protein